MWIVWSNDDGLCGIFENEDEAIKEYERSKKWLTDGFDGEFLGEERVVIAKVEKQLYCRDSKEPVVDYDDDGEEFEVENETYWEWHEEKY